MRESGRGDMGGFYRFRPGRGDLGAAISGKNVVKSG